VQITSLHQIQTKTLIVAAIKSHKTLISHDNYTQKIFSLSTKTFQCESSEIYAILVTTDKMREQHFTIMHYTVKLGFGLRVELTTASDA